MDNNIFLDGLLGLAIGDALGVPYEGTPREVMRKDPARDMIGYRAHNQPEGSWSDDTSMALCSADSLCRGFDPDDMMKKFSAWRFHHQYTATGVVFDVGRTCRKAISKYADGIEAVNCGMAGEDGNGNGGLMRILPVALWRSLTDENDPSMEKFLAPIHTASAITHAHERGLICCGLYSLIVDEWIHRSEKDTFLDVASRAHERGVNAYRAMGGAYLEETEVPNRFIHPRELAGYSEEQIRSGAYVLDTYHAAIWCLLTTESYSDCTLKAVNLGGDTDSTAAVAGGMAGLIYGVDAIPKLWLDKLKNRSLIEQIADKLHRSIFPESETSAITSFAGEYAHLAMKAAAEINIDGVTYQNVSSALLAQKTAPEYREQFSFLTAHQARRLSKQLPERPDWADIFNQTLFEVCLAKYKQNPQLAEKLLSTGKREIIYDTTGAHDNYCGICKCTACRDKEKQNLYGRILMQVRACLF